MNWLNRLPGFVPSPPGLEHRIWQALPPILLWGSLLPVILSLTNRLLLGPDPLSDATSKAASLLDFMMLGLLVAHWMLVLVVSLICLIVRVMKGPAYVADAYPLPREAPHLSDPAPRPPAAPSPRPRNSAGP
jgi:hypothetical protein